MASLTRTDSQEEAFNHRALDTPPEKKEEPSLLEEGKEDKEGGKGNEKIVEDDEFYETVLSLTHEVDDRDYAFLVDFAVLNVTYTVYEQLQSNTFFKKTTDGEGVCKDTIDQELEHYETKGKFRLCQLHPVILRATIGYFTHMAKSYYDATLKTRALNQIPIGLNDKTYGVVCLAIKRLVEAHIDNERVIVKGEKWRTLPIVEEEED